MRRPFGRGPVLVQAQRQVQALAMTPQLRQAIQLLQMSNAELDAWLGEALDANPLLARDEAGPADGAAGPDAQAADSPAGDSPAGDAPAPDESDAALGETQRDNLWNGSGGASGPARAPAPEASAARPSLREHLTTEVSLILAGSPDLPIGLALIDQLDPAGYLTADLAGVAGALGVAPARVEAVATRLVGVEPVGVFARSLADCLAAQLRERDRLDPAMQTLLVHLDVLARGDKARLMRLCGVDAEDLDDMIAEIRSLDPRPALAFDHEPMVPVVPDILVRPAPGGGFAVELNAETLPRLLVDRRYHDTVKRGARARDDRRYLSERLQEANWLVRALDQRARTILKVAAEIVRRQDGFFARGIAHMRPLTLRDIAEAIGMHESTVSRATANKYMATPRGMFDLKFFFSAAISAQGGAESVAAESVRQRIRALVEAETDVLSDDAIVSTLRREGFDLARRTVAKYREALRIPSSFERRRQRALGTRRPGRADANGRAAAS
jgi:RNA polymerase sigma-54 factor